MVSLWPQDKIIFIGVQFKIHLEKQKIKKVIFKNERVTEQHSLIAYDSEDMNSLLSNSRGFTTWSEQLFLLSLRNASDYREFL